MQPYYEAKGLSRVELAGRRVPPLVTQIADGENGGVMMHEFPPKYLEVVGECSSTRTPMMNVTEYLEQLFATGVQLGDLPAIQPLFQRRIWQRMAPGDGPGRLEDVIEHLRLDDSRFHVDGGSWTNDLSWVRGYDQVLIPMEQASALFHERILARGVPRTSSGSRFCWRPRSSGVWKRSSRPRSPSGSRSRPARPSATTSPASSAPQWSARLSKPASRCLPVAEGVLVAPSPDSSG
jgi:hypothetical protein